MPSHFEQSVLAATIEGLHEQAEQSAAAFRSL
jgi:hypothetical protein